METLRQKQSRFTAAVAKLIQHAWGKGYELTFGEAWRTPEQAAWNQKHGKGISKSLHIQRLAVDFNLFKDGIFLADSKDHEPLGLYWESLGEDFCWGGRFGDGNHYSITHQGVK